MTFTISFGWWLIPVVLGLFGVISWVVGSRDPDPFSGPFIGLIGLAFFVGAALAALTGWLAS